MTAGYRATKYTVAQLLSMLNSKIVEIATAVYVHSCALGA